MLAQARERPLKASIGVIGGREVGLHRDGAAICKDCQRDDFHPVSLLAARQPAAIMNDLLPAQIQAMMGKQSP
ncbi:hypothetical protein NM74_22145 [Aeromonas hydrophila]|nr:hypothetical protein NM74_22145 [Aeromonas hydrophila]